jgi:small subunit ribosomal protein S9
MEILARAVGRRKEAVAQVQIVRGTGQFIINDKSAQIYLQNNSCSIICIKSPFELISQYASLPSQSSSLTNPLKVDIEGEGKSVQGAKAEVEPLGSKILGQVPTNHATHVQSGREANSGLEGIQTHFGVIPLDQLDTIVKVKGGGLIGQAEAIKLGVARAFCEIESSSGGDDLSLRKILKTKGYLTQDSRVKERRKYGLKKARKASQYHKR